MSEKTSKPKKTPKLRVVAGQAHDAAQSRTNERPPTAAEVQAIREKWAIDGFDDIDKTILNFLLNKPGMTDGEIATAIGVRRETVNRRKNRPAFQAALEESRLEPIVIFQRNQARAARKLGQLIDAKDEQVAVRAALAHLAPLLKDDRPGESGAEAFAKFLEEAYSYREQRKTPDATTGAPAHA